MKLNIIFLCLVVFCYACSTNSRHEKTNNLFYKRAYEHRDRGEKDSAFFYFNKAKDQFIQDKDSLGAATCIVNMSIIATDGGDLFGGQELSLNAVPFFDEKNPEHHPYILSNYNNLGIASYNLKQYTKAIEFYNKSLEFIPDSAYALIVRNNIANAYRKNEEFLKAIEIYMSVLGQEKNAVNYARALSNFAYTKWLQNPGYNSSKELYQSLSIRLKEKDLWGQNASYAHLADYYLKKRPDSALIFSRKMYGLATKLNSPDDRIEALQKLIPLSDPLDSREYFNIYRSLGDSLQIARNSAKNQFALIRYETEKHKADNLLLQQENTKRNVWLISLAILIIAGSITGVLSYKRRTRRLALQAASAIKESQLKTSKKVHDVVANGLYRLMSEMENDVKIDRDRILDDMEVLYERSRDISYDDVSLGLPGYDFQSSISSLLMSFATPDTRVVIVGNTSELWAELNQDAKSNLYYVLQELMVNMTKHSEASSVAIRFERKADNIKVFYTDNGAGLPEGAIFKNGLTNTGNRIKSIHGSITFGEGTTGGLNVQIQFPVRFDN